MAIERGDQQAVARQRCTVGARWCLGLLAILLPALVFGFVFWPGQLDGLVDRLVPSASLEVRMAVRALAGLLLLAYLLMVRPRAAAWVRRRSPEALDAGSGRARAQQAGSQSRKGVPRAGPGHPARPYAGRSLTAGRARSQPTALDNIDRLIQRSAGSIRVDLGLPVDLRLSDLEGRDLEGAFLQGRALHGANLRAATLGWAALPQADLSFADLRQAFLAAADLRGADLTGANLRGACLVAADMRGADLRLADLRGANCRAADLRGAGLESSRLEGADLRGANLEGVDLRNATIEPGRLRVTANLAGAYMPDGRLRA